MTMEDNLHWTRLRKLLEFILSTQMEQIQSKLKMVLVPLEILAVSKDHMFIGILQVPVQNTAISILVPFMLVD